MFNYRNRYLLVFLLAIYSYANSVVSGIYPHYHIYAPWYDVLLVFLLITLLVWETNRWIVNRKSKFNLPSTTLKPLVVNFIFGALCSSLLSVAILYCVGHFMAGINIIDLKLAAILAVTYGTRINVFLHIVNGAIFFANKYKSKELEAEELKRINSQAQLQLIKQQINPHFLFNNLNVLSSMVMQENPESNKFIEEFAKVYRHILNSHEQELIPLKDELDFVQPYLFLLKKRFPGGIVVNIDIPSAFGTYFIVPVSLQMLIENAVKHNVVSKNKPLIVTIALAGNDRVLVSNNLQPKIPNEASKKIGLENIRQRYKIITGQPVEIEKTAHIFKVLIPLLRSAS